MDVLIPRNTLIPCGEIFTYITEKDYQKEFILKIFQGERLLAKGNKKLKEFIIKIPSKRKGEEKIDIIFSLYDINTLHVTTIVNDSYEDIFINIDTLNEEEINDIIRVAGNMKNKDLEKIKNIKYKNELENYVIKVKSITEEMIEWINNHPKENNEKYNEMLLIFRNKLK